MHSLTKISAVTLLGALLCGCSALDRIENIGEAPKLAPVGNPADAQIVAAIPATPPIRHDGNSLWQPGAKTFFQDPRASHVGDVITVNVSVADAAKLQNSTTRSRANSDNANMTNMFGLENARPQASEVNGKTRIEPIEKYGIKLLSIGFFTDPNQPVPWRGPMVSTAVKQLFNDADWGELDYLVVDLPPGTGDIHITVTQTFPVTGAVIVTTPQNVALADAKKGIGMFMMPAINVPLLGVVENMAYFTPAELPENKYYIFGQGGGRKLAAQLDVPFLGEIPLVKGISESGDQGKPIVLDEESLMARAFIEMAKSVAQQVAISNAKAFEKTTAGQ